MDFSAFSARIASRHASQLPVYHRDTHTYDPAYLMPTAWTVLLHMQWADELRQLKHALTEAAKPVPRSETSHDGTVHVRPHRDVQADLDAQEEQLDELNAQIDEIESFRDTHRFKIRLTRILEHPIPRRLVLTEAGHEPEIRNFDGATPLSLPGSGQYEITVTVTDKNTGAEHSQATHALNVRDMLICSLGDSYASGEGCPDVKTAQDFSFQANLGGLDTLRLIRASMEVFISPNATAATWQEPLAHRSWKSSHSLAAQFVERALSDKGLTTTYIGMSRSGAGVYKGMIVPGKATPSILGEFIKVPRGARPSLPDPHHVAFFRFFGNEDEYVAGIVQSQPGNLDTALGKGQVDELNDLLSTAATQLNSEWSVPRRPDILLITAGGNDIDWIPGFVDILKPFGDGIDEVEKRVQNAIADKLPEGYRHLNRKLGEMLMQPRRVLITEYPEGFFGTPGGGTRSGCGVFDSWSGVVDITEGEAKRIQALSKKLNDALKALVDELNQTNAEYNASHPASKRDFRYVFVDGIKERFADHGYCAPQPFFVGAGQSYREQGDSRGLLHPNEDGNRAMAAAMAGKILELIESDVGLGHLR